MQPRALFRLIAALVILDQHPAGPHTGYAFDATREALEFLLLRIRLKGRPE